jgi:hypothetical protein
MTPHQQTWWPIRHPGLVQSVSMPFDSNPDFAHTLGMILERWTVLESTLANALACFIDDNEIAARAILYSLNATRVRIQMVRNVARELMPDGPEKRGFIWLLDKISDHQGQRNEYIHGEYWHNQDASGFDLVMIRPMNSETFTIRPVTLDDLKAHIAKCDEYEFCLSLAIDPEPEGNVPNMTRVRSRELSRYNSRHAPAMVRSREAP